MLFDLRGRRRRFIQVIYAFLALLLGGGLVIFGIGGDAAGGLADAVGLRDQSGAEAAGLDDQIEELEEAIEQNPRDAAALLRLAQVRVQVANTLVEEEDGFPVENSESREERQKAAEAWDRYIALDPPQTSQGAAVMMAQSFFALAQSAPSATSARVDLRAAAQAQQVAADANPNPGTLGNLALFLYFAGQFGPADRAAERAVAAAPPGQRHGVRQELDSFKQQARNFDQQLEAERQAGAEQQNPLEGGVLGGG